MAIRLLAEDVSSKIAAGEVIERPASVVKELVENSIDAGSTEITVEIAGGGVDMIRISDNGHGIPANEVALAFQRFATSKVSSVEDLGTITSLGFRGEALPSISAVSTVTLVTRTPGEDSGTRIEIDEGRSSGIQPAGTSPGTTITVRQLFRNFPVRRKFLRTIATETSRVQTLVTRYALAYPEIRFRLETGKGSAFSSEGSGELRDAISSVYDLNVAQAMLELPSLPVGEVIDPFVWGMISPPSLDRANRSYVSFFVNRRWVQNRMLGYALEQAYHGFLMERRFPLAVVNISISPEEIDVNVHPSKSEIRFRRDNAVFSAMQQAVRATLTAHSPVPEIRRASTTMQSTGGIAYPQAPSPSAFWPIEPFTRRGAPAPLTSMPSSNQSASYDLPPAQDEPAASRNSLPMLRVLGQAQSTYIIAEGPDGVYMIDQHAAHERVVFEQVRADMLASTPNIQSLLEPATIELDPRHMEIVESQAEVMARLGLIVEPFGTNLVLLRGVPSILKDGDPSQAFVDVLDLMAEGGDFETWEERAAYSMACHGAIRAGKAMTHSEMTELTRQLEACQQPHNCPHGRPTMIHMSSGHLEREFGRT